MFYDSHNYHNESYADDKTSFNKEFCLDEVTNQN